MAIISAIALTATMLAGCAPKFTPKANEAGWYATWGTAMYDASADETPINPALKENTVRQQIRVSIGGDKIKLTFSNLRGDIPLVIESVHIAKMPNAGADNSIDVSTDTVVTFGGQESVTIEAGMTATSDEIPFSFDALEDIAVTMKMGKFVGGAITCHRAARANSWVVEGDHVSDEKLEGGKTMTSWYYLTEVSTYAEAGTKTIVCFGDSITDGANTTTNSFSRWSDELSRQLAANGYKVGVVNKGIGGNAIFGGLGQAAKDRFDRDVLEVEGVRACIVMIGINDIGSASEDTSDTLIEQYKIMIEKCHANGIAIYGATLTPIKGNGYYSELHEQIRTTLNDFIKSPKSGFDGYIDFEEVMKDPADPLAMRADYIKGWNDYLHPGDAGYAVMGKQAYDSLVAIWEGNKQ